MTKPIFHSETELITFLEREIPKEGLSVIAICGDPGAGKTTLAFHLAERFKEKAFQLSEDHFITVPTPLRKSYLAAAMQEQDRLALEKLAKPDNPADNPYADPQTWYDLVAVATTLKQLKTGQSVTLDKAWSQATGECDQRVVYSNTGQNFRFCFVDSTYPLAYKEQIDCIVYLAIDQKTAFERQQERDAHRSDACYFAYKQRLQETYGNPYLAKVHQQADCIYAPTPSDTP